MGGREGQSRDDRRSLGGLWPSLGIELVDGVHVAELEAAHQLAQVAALDQGGAAGAGERDQPHAALEGCVGDGEDSPVGE